ncbi:TetR/AcrR family transcriptional regulator [Embleya hyalina]|uniref:TetR family transcriptional regulator n=1 Tax=Embleya hyalina TaxID=516124 RepID=A0A401Z1W9_9ACTN|nr:TetR/AcrR family transcriptional regulator [Embleya hyalina]GCE00832.1 TetR family transcriptional regulator [Embleya hyalina]
MSGPTGTGEPAAPATARRPRRDAEANRRRIVRAGREVFGARGLQATLNDVAHHAGLGVGTVYRKFSDKRALAEVVFGEELDEIAAMARDALDRDDAFDALAEFLERALARAAHNRGLRELMRQGVAEGTGLARARREIHSHCERLVEQARDQGGLREGVTAADIARIAVMIDAVMALPAEQPAGQPTEQPSELWRRYLVIILDGLRAHRHQPPLPEPTEARRPRRNHPARSTTKPSTG